MGGHPPPKWQYAGLGLAGPQIGVGKEVVYLGIARRPWLGKGSPPLGFPHTGIGIASLQYEWENEWEYWN